MNKHEREWGWFTVLYDDEHSNHKLKKIYIYPGKKNVLQSHNERNKHWVIVKGKARVQLNDRIFTMYENEYIYIPTKIVHQVENTGSDLLEISETQYGSYLGEDDVVLYEDDYGRLK